MKLEKNMMTTLAIKILKEHLSPSQKSLIDLFSIFIQLTFKASYFLYCMLGTSKSYRNLYGMTKLNKCHGKYRVFIKVESIDFGSNDAKKSQGYTICIGPKVSYMPYSYKFKRDNKPITKVWEFWYNSYKSSSFSLALFKNNLILDNELIGMTNVKLSSFPKDSVSTGTFELKLNNEKLEPISVKLMVHICENGSKPFDPTTMPMRKKQFKPMISNLVAE